MARAEQRLGRWGEQKVLALLKKQGYRVLETNYRTVFGEIDIIALKKNTLCFIEVKTRKYLNKGLPRESVTASKQKKIIQAAQLYLKQQKDQPDHIRFDVAEVYAESGSPPRINLILNAFWGAS